MRMIGAAAFLGVLAGWASAEGAERDWAHKDWRAEMRGEVCSIHTGGDAEGSFRLEFDRGGFNAEAIYHPLWYRSEPQPLDFDDGFEILIDGEAIWLGDELSVYVGADEYGDYFRAAALTSGFVQELATALRAGGRIGFVVLRAGREPALYDELSLSGFTANFLKAAEWCGFNPDALPAS
ncbi:MAG: hypothetical protein ACE37J_01980 [Pikeienuella sp.]|uniref:hypothetical protein n=1 Tax=Pikeienuella sp. TaxID=2831957 RepID=UPI00391CF9E6